MKHVLKGLFYCFIASVIFYTCGLLDVHAAVKIITDSVTITPVQSSALLDPSATWPVGTDTTTDRQWIKSIGFTESSGAMQGTWLNVSADFYVAVTTYYDKTSPTLYIYSDRNILKSENVRCSVSNGLNGYDGSYTPIVDDFNFEYVNGMSATMWYHSIIHVQFKYTQRLSTLIQNNGANISCWFNSNPSNALVMQLMGQAGEEGFYGYMNSFSGSVTNDPNTALLQDIVGQNNMIISGQAQIISNNTQNSQNIINNNNNNTQDIIDAQSDNTQEIIDNQNANNQAMIDSQMVCEYIDKNKVKTKGIFLYAQGYQGQQANLGVTDAIKINKDSKLKVLTARTGAASLVFYDINHQYISGISNGSMTDNQYITIPQNAAYFVASIQWEENKPTYELCRPGNQATSDSINDLNNSINNSDITNPSNEFNQFEGMIATNGVITDLITLPISLFTNISNSINGTCSNFNLGNLLGTDLVIPCIDLSEYLGSFLWNVIDILFSGLFVYTIGKRMIVVFENMTSMKEDDDLS